MRKIDAFDVTQDLQFFAVQVLEIGCCNFRAGWCNDCAKYRRDRTHDDRADHP